MSKNFVYCTLSNDHYITNWTRPADKQMRPEAITDKEKKFPVFIQGGANVATSPESERGRHTPKGIVTEITDAQLEYCRANKFFCRQEKAGLIIVISSDEDPNKVAADMTARDAAAPLHPNSEQFKDVENEENVRPMGAIDKAKEGLKAGVEGLGRVFR